jgi:hypothetical protein
MSEIAATVLQDAIIKVSQGSFLSFENRLSNYGALQAFKDNAGGFLPASAVEGIKKSVRQPEKIPVLNKFTPSIITSPVCNITGNRPVSAYMPITWAYVGFQTKIIPSLNDDNYISVVDDLAQQMRMGFKALFGNLDTTAVAKLESSKTAAAATSGQSNIATSASGYDYTGDPKEFFPLYAPGLMGINDMEGPFNDVANTEALSTILRIETYGQYNEQNLRAGIEGGLPYSLGFRNYMTNRVSPGSHKEVHYLFPDGSIGVYNWVDPDSVAGRRAGNKSWGTMQDPFFGFDWGTYTVEDCEDASAQSTGLTRAYSKIMEIGAYFAFVTEYSSDTTSPIVKVIFEDSGS